MSSFIEREVKRAIADFARGPVFARLMDNAIADGIESLDEPPSWRAFVWAMAAHIYREAQGSLSMPDSMKTARKAYDEFKRDNRIKRFGEDGWDWSKSGARIVATEYETACW